MNANRWFACMILLLLFVFGGAVKLRDSNYVTIELDDCADSELATLAMLDETLERNFLNRDHYQVFSHSKNGPCRIADYDKERKLLQVCTDPGSGWSGFFKVSQPELHQLVVRSAKFDDLYKLCKPYSFKEL